MLYLMFQSICVYILYWKSLVETILYSEIVELDITLRKLMERKKNEKREKCGLNIHVEITGSGEM